MNGSGRCTFYRTVRLTPLGENRGQDYPACHFSLRDVDAGRSMRFATCAPAAAYGSGSGPDRADRGGSGRAVRGAEPSVDTAARTVAASRQEEGGAPRAS